LVLSKRLAGRSEREKRSELIKQGERKTVGGSEGGEKENLSKGPLLSGAGKFRGARN